MVSEFIRIICIFHVFMHSPVYTSKISPIKKISPILKMKETIYKEDKKKRIEEVKNKLNRVKNKPDILGRIGDSFFKPSVNKFAINKFGIMEMIDRLDQKEQEEISWWLQKKVENNKGTGGESWFLK